ncbi:MAG: hypothetical protein CMQ45_02195 [Gammaproteobacteria bacterium]|nr:hypothetical protein [Gammaproteobacteria bacterium]
MKLIIDDPRSLITAEEASNQSGEIGHLQVTGKGLFFTNCIDGDLSRMAIWLKTDREKPRQITPYHFSVRTKVHEYGGKPYIVVKNCVYFVNSDDQAVYCLPLEKANLSADKNLGIEVITPPNSGFRYADFAYDRKRDRLICVREHHADQESIGAAASKVANCIVSLPIGEGKATEGEVLFAKSDFVSSPTLSADSNTLAFIWWDHPNMPWDTTSLAVASLTEEGHFSSVKNLRGPCPASIVQPRFNSDGQLYFISDWSGWWNIYRYDESCNVEGTEPINLIPLDAEVCAAQWQLGKYNYDFGEDGSITASICSEGRWSVLHVDANATQRLPEKEQNYVTMLDGFGQVDCLCVSCETLYFCGATSTELPGIYSIALPSGKKNGRKSTPRRLIGSGKGLELASISRPFNIEFETGENEKAFAFFYPPNNPKSRTNIKNPPLIVGVHGGPTSAARAVLNLKVQFWTSRGFAFLDVNHRGSTGWGKEFRHRLYQNWGLVDIEDIENGVRHVIREGLVDPSRIAIRGGSAGGYSVMACLANSDLFALGVSYYGISDLEMLARETHKFESHYLDKLIGPMPEMRSRYIERSPIHKIGNISAPLLLLQGLEDKVVPPSQAELICNKLQRQGTEVAYICFPDEGHGFRKSENQIRSLSAELEFYLKYF